MPRKPIEWSKCIIYKIWKDDHFYVGSTTNFTNRKRGHKCSCNSEKVKSYNLKIYQTIREKGGWDSWQMTPLEEYIECKSQIEAIIREEEWRVKLNAQLNMRKAHRAETQQEYNAQYYQEHKENNAQYYQEHKEQINEKSKQWYKEHKEKLNAKFECECGGKYAHQNKSQHEKSIKHQIYLATLT